MRMECAESASAKSSASAEILPTLTLVFFPPRCSMKSGSTPNWAGDLAGRVIPPGPDDPIKSRWLGFYNGAGIHGTDEISSLGTAASHGCIRMSIPDVEQLYPQVPLHTPIYVG